MKVLLLVHGLPIGGTEKMVCALARELRRAGVEVLVGCLDEPGELGRGLEAEGFPFRLFARRPGFDAALPLRIARTIRADRVDLVHAHQYTPFFYGALAKLRAAVPLVFTEHGRFFPDRPSWKRRLFNLAFARCANRITAVSRGVRESLRAVEWLDPRRIEVIYNGVPMDAVSRLTAAAARELLGIPAGARVVGTVGRLDPIKNHVLLCKGFERLSASVPNAWLAIAGDGPERGRLEAAIAGLPSRSRIRLLGMRADIPDVLRAFDIFTLTSLSEGTPMTVLEAMAACVPVVSAAIGGIPEVIEDGRHGILVPGQPPAGNDPGVTTDHPYVVDFAAQLRRALTDNHLGERLAREARERCARELSLEAATRRYLELYRELVPRDEPLNVTVTRSQ